MDEATKGVALSPRKRPSTARGQARFDLILSTSRKLLLDTGVDALNSEDIAANAGIPVGSVYQYFPNKFAIVAELAEQDTAALEGALETYGSMFPAVDWQQQTDSLIDHLAEQWRHDPSRRSVWLAMQSIEPTRALAAQHSRRLTRAVLVLIMPLTPDLHSRRRLTVAEVVVEMCNSLLHFSVHDGHPHPATVRELKRALRSYLRAVAIGA
ncbi:MAG: TetR/AcrR family transcriptional regulator [Microthrixaceae bacterium]